MYIPSNATAVALTLLLNPILSTTQQAMLELPAATTYDTAKKSDIVLRPQTAADVDALGAFRDVHMQIHATFYNTFMPHPSKEQQTVYTNLLHLFKPHGKKCNIDRLHRLHPEYEIKIWKSRHEVELSLFDAFGADTIRHYASIQHAVLSTYGGVFISNNDTVFLRSIDNLLVDADGVAAVFGDGVFFAGKQQQQGRFTPMCFAKQLQYDAQLSPVDRDGHISDDYNADKPLYAYIDWNGDVDDHMPPIVVDHKSDDSNKTVVLFAISIALGIVIIVLVILFVVISRYRSR